MLSENWLNFTMILFILNMVSTLCWRGFRIRTPQEITYLKKSTKLISFDFSKKKKKLISFDNMALISVVFYYYGLKSE